MAVKRRQGNRLRFSRCPRCGKKELYKNGHEERCRRCGLWLIRLPGQDF